MRLLLRPAASPVWRPLPALRALQTLGLVRIVEALELERRARADDRFWWVDAEPAGVLAGGGASRGRRPQPSADRDGGGFRAAPDVPWGPRRAFVAELRDIRLVGDRPLAATGRRGEVLAEVLAPAPPDRKRAERAIGRLIAWSGFRNGLAMLRSPSPAPGAPVFDHAAVLFGLNNNYYHWTIEQLPKLRGLEAYREHTGEMPALIVSTPLHPDAREQLAMLIPDADYVEWRWSDGLARRLVIPSYPVPTIADLRWLRARARAAVATGHPARDERILISREDSPTRWRRVVNEGELAEALAELGFRRYRLSELGFAEEVRLFAQAEAVVAPHGAGLANLVWSDRAAVLELLSGQVSPVFHRLCGALGLRYDYLGCEPVGIEMRVDVAAVRGAVEGMLGGRG